MPKNDKLISQIEQLKLLAETVDFGNLKTELGTNHRAIQKIEQLQQALTSVDFGDLKNELGKKGSGK